MAGAHGDVAFPAQSSWFHPKVSTFHFSANKAKIFFYLTQGKSRSFNEQLSPISLTPGGRPYSPDSLVETVVSFSESWCEKG